jgi:hypothetical protein
MNDRVVLVDATGEAGLTKEIGFDAVAFVRYRLYLPLVLQNYLGSIESKKGIHLGNRQNNWPDSTLSRIDGSPDGDGIWPQAVVVLSSQLYILDRHPEGGGDGLCRIAQAWVGREELYTYLTEAQQDDVKVIIRIEPSPGNFEDWDDPALPHTLRADMTLAGDDYCNEKFKRFRAIDDIATEMNEIYKLNVRNGWDPANFFFEPANEPNNEWYSHWEEEEVQNMIQTADAWLDMDTYFSALYDHVHFDYPDSNIQVLTPPMAQGNFAETKRLVSCVPMTVTVYGESGYDWMGATFTVKNDGYSWHNYWRAGKETWVTSGDPCPNSEHIFQYFPQWLQTSIASSNKPAFITEADLFSPCQENDNPITDKDVQFEETQESLWQFVSQEEGADCVIAWLLTEYPYSKVAECPTGPTDYEEIRWHQAYEDDSERAWFWPWWSRPEE